MAGAGSGALTLALRSGGSSPPLEKTIAGGQLFHQHEWKSGTFRLQRSHQHGGEWHQHPISELVDQVKTGRAMMQSIEEAE